MNLQAGRAYRAKTVSGEVITFRVTEASGPVWVMADLDSPDGAEPNVWLNTNALVWVSGEAHRADALSRATAEVIDSLEHSADPRGSARHRPP